MNFDPIWTSHGRLRDDPRAIDVHAGYQRLLDGIPPLIRATLTPVQLAALADASKPTTAHHAIDFRASVPFFGSRFYVTFLLGKERRSRQRLLDEHQISLSKSSILYFTALWSLVALVTTSLVTSLYLVKSMLGIDLFAGHTFLLHSLFF